MNATKIVKEIIQKIIEIGKWKKEPHVDINAGELATILGLYRGSNKNRVAIVSKAMMAFMRPGDAQLFSTPKQNGGASVTIRYIT